jgi:hypothetical protein
MLSRRAQCVGIVLGAVLLISGWLLEMPSDEESNETIGNTTPPVPVSTSVVEPTRPTLRTRDTPALPLDALPTPDIASAPPLTVVPCPLNLLQHETQANAAPRYLTFEPVAPRFGLTNQLITYTSAIFVGVLSRRAVAIPNNTAPDFFDIIDVPATEANLPCGVKLYALGEVQHEADGKKSTRLHLPGRTTVLDHPARARDELDRQLTRYGMRRGIRLSTVMWHVPYVPSDSQRQLNEHRLFRALTFSARVRNQVRRIKRALGGDFVQYAALHVRAEADVNVFSLEPPTEDTFRRFIERCVVPALPKAVEVVYISAGKLQPAIERVLNESFTPRRVIMKNDPRLRSSKVVLSDSLVKGTPITNHYDAAADLEVAVGATFVMTADWSSFAKAIQLRRCPEGGQGAAGRIWTYEKEWKTLSPRDCDDPQGLTSRPFSYTPGYTIPATCRV